MNSMPHSPEAKHQKAWNMENPKLRRVFVCAPGESPHVFSVWLEWRHSRVKYTKRKLHIHCQIQNSFQDILRCLSFLHWISVVNHWFIEKIAENYPLVWLARVSPVNWMRSLQASSSAKLPILFLLFVHRLTASKTMACGGRWLRQLLTFFLRDFL